MKHVFLDANIFLRFLTKGKNNTHKKQATTFFQALEDQTIIIYTHSLVLHEVIYVLLHVYDHDKKEIVRAVQSIIQQKNIKVLDVTKTTLLKALDAFMKQSIDFPDCLYAYTVQDQGCDLASLDNDFKKLNMQTIQEI